MMGLRCWLRVVYFVLMVNSAELREWAMAFPEAVEAPHFEKASFRVKKKIFATLDEPRHRAVVKLSPVEQSVFSAYDNTIIYPLDGTWGKQGWTAVELKKVRKGVCRDVLRAAYCNVAPKKLAAQAGF